MGLNQNETKVVIQSIKTLIKSETNYFQQVLFLKLFLALNWIKTFKGTTNIPPKYQKLKNEVLIKTGLSTTVEINRVISHTKCKGIVPTSI